jgi:hypothetical protein
MVVKYSVIVTISANNPMSSKYIYITLDNKKKEWGVVPQRGVQASIFTYEVSSASQMLSSFEM